MDCIDLFKRAAMALQTDPRYLALDQARKANDKDVRAAYRKRAKQFHPDLHPNDPKAKAKFQALNEAYEVISDPEKRAKYDSTANSGRM